MSRSFHASHGKIRLHRLGVTVDEVKDAMTAGIHAGNDVRPGHRALRRNTATEFTETAVTLQLLEVGHAPILHVPTQELGVEAIDPQHDNLVGYCPIPRVQATGKNRP